MSSYIILLQLGTTNAMANNETENALNDLSMVLFESDAENPVALKKMATPPLERLSKTLSNDPHHQEIKSAVLSILAAGDISADSLSRFVQAVQTVMQNPSAPFEAEGISSSATRKSHPDFASNIDQELLIEFIEKHTSGLDEFEALLLESNRDDTDFVEVSKVARGYIHNIKGDAGSLGINGIEKVCHYIEDKIDENGVKGIIEPLLIFKEWAASWVQCMAKGDYSGESAESFMKTFAQALEECGAGDQKEAVITPVSTSSNDSDLSGANLDLLAELLADNKEEAPRNTDAEYPIEGDPEVFTEFVAEAEDHLGAVENTILEASGSYDKEMIDTIFRGVHSIKGASSYFKLLEITETSHHTESLMDEVRVGKRLFDPGLAELILVFVDLQRKLISHAKEMAAKGEHIKRMEASEKYLNDLEVYTRDGKTSVPLAPVKVANVPTESTPKPQKQAVDATSAPAAVTAPKGEKGEDKGEKLDIKNYVKVETDRLDHLIDAIGEMAIYSSMLIDNVRQTQAGNEHLIKVTHQVEKFSRELQQIGMGMRLIPIRGLFQKMSRLVWDVARKIGKEVKFSMEGEDTELDRTIIEKLADPLMHMIRNAIDHGVEGPDERTAAKKERTGHIELRAFHSGGSIHVQIIDDGRGLNPEKLINKAKEKGIIGENDKLTDKEAYNLIFAAGFSTAAAVTDISGRGVGMDVVRRNIESMRGRVNIDSVLGSGTTFTIELPLTLAIIDGISVKVGIETFVIPTLSVVEFMQPKRDQITRALDKGETFSFRGKFLPLYRLGNLFDVDPKNQRLEDSLVVVVEHAGTQFALLVDEISSTHSTVIKSVGEMFSTNRGLAGCAIMPSGDIALILDLRSLLELAKDTYSYDRILEKNYSAATIEH